MHTGSPSGYLQLHSFPSSQDLKFRILVKGKTQSSRLGQMGKSVSSASFASSCEDDETSSNKSASKKDPTYVSLEALMSLSVC